MIFGSYEGSYREKYMRGGERVYVGTLFRRIVLARQKVAYPVWNSIVVQGKKNRSEKFDLSMDLARFPEKKKNFMGYGFRLYRDFQLNGHFISLEIPI